MKLNTLHIWYQKPLKLTSPSKSDYEVVEKFLISNFVNGYPVLVSSGRAAIAALIDLFWKNETINIFKYASQCVVNACVISRVSPKTPIQSSEDIVYHQWGYFQTRQKTDIFIEDASDTFKPIGSRVLNLESRFELWSLPKILGIRSGAVIWCREKSDAQELIKFRNSKNKTSLKLFLKYLKPYSFKIYKRWEYLELTNCSLNKFQIGAIYKEIVNWENVFRTRHTLLKSKIFLLRQSGFKGQLDNEVEILEGTLLPAVIIAADELKNYTNHSITLNRINSSHRPYPVRILPVWTVFS